MTLLQALMYLKNGTRIENKITHNIFWLEGNTIMSEEGPVSFNIMDPAQLEQDDYMFASSSLLSHKEKKALNYALSTVYESIEYIKKVKCNYNGKYYLLMKVKNNDYDDMNYYSDYFDEKTYFLQLKEDKKYNLKDLGLDERLDGNDLGSKLNFHHQK